MTLDKIFSGKWTFKRVINDREIIEGTAKFTESKGNARLYEEGGKRGVVKFYQSNKYVLNANVLRIYNKDALMHTLDFKTSIPPCETSHTYCCLNDVYKCVFKIISENEFEIFYRVTGPKKNYTLSTTYKSHPKPLPKV